MLLVLVKHLPRTQNDTDLHLLLNNLRYTDDTTLMGGSKEELKSLLMKVKEESEKNSLKTQHSKNEDHGIRSHHFTANRMGNNGNRDRFYFLGPQNHGRW